MLMNLDFPFALDVDPDTHSTHCYHVAANHPGSSAATKLCGVTLKGEYTTTAPSSLLRLASSVISCSDEDKPCEMLNGLACRL